MKKTSNPFYDDIQRNGITLVLPLAPRQRGNCPHDDRARTEIVIQPGRAGRPGRPRRGETPRPSRTKSVRLSNCMWEALYEGARRDHTTVNAQIRRAVEAWQHGRGYGTSLR
jgi:hypothetical protein